MEILYFQYLVVGNHSCHVVKTLVKLLDLFEVFQLTLISVLFLALTAMQRVVLDLLPIFVPWRVRMSRAVIFICSLTARSREPPTL